jgi:tetratricopeptide (TPR) repeat protein
LMEGEDMKGLDWVIGAGVVMGVCGVVTFGAASQPATRTAGTAPVTRGAGSAPLTQAAATRPVVRLMDPAQIAKLGVGEAYAEAVKYFAAGEQVKGEPVFQKLLDKFPKDQRVMFAGGVIERSRFDVEGAKPMLQAAQINPGSAMGQCATMMLNIDANKDADASFAKLMAQTKQAGVSPMILWLGGIAGRTLNRNAEGAECYRALLKQWDPGPVLVHQTFANLLDQLEKYDEALVHRKMAVQMEPAGWSYQGLGLTYANLRRWADAEAAYAKALEYSPKSRYWFDWAYALLEVVPGDANGLNLWGRCLVGKKDYEGALGKFQEAMQADSKFVWAYSNAALAAEKSGHREEAIEYRNLEVTKAPTAQAYADQGAMYDRMLKFDLAISSYQEAAKLAPNDVQILTGLADALYNGQKPGEAIVICQQALAIKPDNPVVYDIWGLALAMEDKREEAVEVLKKGLTPEIPEIYAHLSIVLNELGRKEESQKISDEKDALDAKIKALNR